VGYYKRCIKARGGNAHGQVGAGYFTEQEMDKIMQTNLDAMATYVGVQQDDDLGDEDASATEPR
jgi:hypothetical protein